MPDDEALRFEFQFEDGKIKGFEIEIDTLEIKIADELIILNATDFHVEHRRGGR